MLLRVCTINLARITLERNGPSFLSSPPATTVAQAYARVCFSTVLAKSTLAMEAAHIATMQVSVCTRALALCALYCTS